MKKNGAVWRSSVTNAHYHIAFIREDGVGASSNNGDPKHVHVIVFENGAFVYRSAQDGHIHEIGTPLQETFGEPKDESADEDKIAKDCVDLYKDAVETEKESHDDGIESEGFYDGSGQWEEEAKRKLAGQDRCSLTLNFTQANVDLMQGYQRQNRTDIRCLPMEGGDSIAADTYTATIKNILDQCNFPLEESNTFRDELVSGRGTFNIYVDYDQDPMGKIVVERFPWEDFYAGPHDKQDLSDAEHIHKCRWYPSSRVMTMWPKTKDKIQMLITGTKPEETEQSVFQGEDGQYYKTMSIENFNATHDSDLVDKVKKQIKVIETWRKAYYVKKSLVSQANNWSMEVTDWESADVELAAEIPDFDVIESTGFRFYRTLTAATVLISNELQDADVQEFPCVPAYAHKLRDKYWGIVQVVKDAQREVNFRHSQGVDVVNAMAAYGWFFDQQTFPDHHEEEKFKRTSTSPGFVVKLNDVGRPPVQTMGTKIPAEILQMEQLAEAKIKTLLNLPDLPRDPTSGKQIIEYRRTGLVGSDYLFDNLDFAKRRIGLILIKMIQKYYSPERIIRLLEDQSMKTPIELGGQKVQGRINEGLKAQIQRMLETSDLANYDIIVDISPYSASARRANFMYWLQAAQFVPTPPEFLLELSDLPEKDKFKQILQANAERQAQEQQAKSNMEIQKTLIAAQAKSGGTRIPPGAGAQERISPEGR